MTSLFLFCPFFCPYTWALLLSLGDFYIKIFLKVPQGRTVVDVVTIVELCRCGKIGKRLYKDVDIYIKIYHKAIYINKCERQNIKSEDIYKRK